MPIDIANMIMNIKAAQNFDWGNFLAAGFGALSAYWLNRRSEDKKENEINKQNFKRLYYMTSDILTTFLNLQANVIDKCYNSIGKYNTLSDYENNLVIGIVTKEYKYTADYSLIFLEKHSKYILPLVDAIKQHVEIFNQALSFHNEFLKLVKDKDYKTFDDFENDGKIKINIENSITGLKANSNILICFTYALMTILRKYKDKFLSQDEIVNIDFNQNQINVILKNAATLDAIPEYIKEGFSFFTNKQNNICPESSIVM
jgi:hypothetical protein